MCPFVDQGDARCAAYLSLHHLDEALTRCADHYDQCPIYRRKLLSDASHADKDADRVVAAG